MDFVEEMRGVTFIKLEPNSVQVIENLQNTKTIETIWERDPGDAPWFDFSMPDSTSSTRMDLQDDSTQSVLIYELEKPVVDRVNYSSNTTQTDDGVFALIAIAGMVNYAPADNCLAINPSIFEKQTFLIIGEYYTFHLDKITNSQGISYVLPLNIVLYSKICRFSLYSKY